jgi:ethanolamine ammonia-lyase small subunit
MSDSTNLTPARINRGRTGTRPPVSEWLMFRADHARAQDAVHSELSEEFLNAMATKGYPLVQSICSSRTEFIRRPPYGKTCSDAELTRLSERCQKNKDVQIVISDGLSATAVERNVDDLLPIIHDGLELAGLSYGTPVVVRFGRVAVGDQIAHHLGARLVINLIGERPGLSTDESLSAYITLNPGPQTISSDRTVVSNIHRSGTPPLEAGAYVVQRVRKIFQYKLSGVKLQQAENQA